MPHYEWYWEMIIWLKSWDKITAPLSAFARVFLYSYYWDMLFLSSEMYAYTLPSALNPVPYHLQLYSLSIYLIFKMIFESFLYGCVYGFFKGVWSTKIFNIIKYYCGTTVPCAFGWVMYWKALEVFAFLVLIYSEHLYCILMGISSHGENGMYWRVVKNENSLY